MSVGSLLKCPSQLSCCNASVDRVSVHVKKQFIFKFWLFHVLCCIVLPLGPLNPVHSWLFSIYGFRLGQLATSHAPASPNTSIRAGNMDHRVGFLLHILGTCISSHLALGQVTTVTNLACLHYTLVQSDKNVWHNSMNLLNFPSLHVAKLEASFSLHVHVWCTCAPASLEVYAVCVDHV